MKVHAFFRASLARTNFLVLSAVLLVAGSAHATVLTFDLYNDAGKTIYTGGSDAAPGNVFIPQAYGDNVNDFSPAGAVGGTFVNYGSGGGFTPNVTVEYRYYRVSNPTDPNPGNNGPPSGLLWKDNYGDLTNVLYAGYVPTWALEVRLIPAAGYQVTLDSFEASAYGQSPTAVITQSGETLKAVKNANSPGVVTLWSADSNGDTIPDPDGTVVLHGRNTVNGPRVHDTYAPGVTVAAGDTLSLLAAYVNGNSGIDTIQFSQLLIPEPASLALIAAGVTLAGMRRRHAR